MKIENIETPALLIDLDRLEENEQRATELIKSIGCALRPHYKSHKSTFLAHRQIAKGAKGITCAKLGEAEDLVLAGVEDVLIANQIIEPAKIARLAYLAGCARVTVCVDDEENVLALQAAAAQMNSRIYCLVEYELGMNRCGVSDFASVLRLAKRIAAQPNLSFEGIQSYAGQLSHETDLSLRVSEVANGEGVLRDLLAYLKENGVAVKEVSGASTGTFALRTKDTVYTEIQAGTYLLMDAAYDRVVVPFVHSLSMLTTVISAGENRLVCDAGMKSFGMDQGNPVFVDFPEERVEMSEEHSAVYCAHGKKIGDKLRMIPGHCCTTMNLHDKVYLVRGDRVVDRIEITSRGKSL